MSKRTVRTLTRAFGALELEQLGNLMHHVEQETPIYCNHHTVKDCYFDDDGFA